MLPGHFLNGAGRTDGRTTETWFFGSRHRRKLFPAAAAPGLFYTTARQILQHPKQFGLWELHIPKLVYC